MIIAAFFLTLTMPPEISPTLTSPAIVSGTVNTTVNFTFNGLNLQNASSLFIDQLKVVAAFSKNTNDTVTVQFKVPRLSVGLHTLRISTVSGITNVRAFAVDDLPQDTAKVGLTKKETPHVVDEHCMIAGVTTNDASDFYKYRVPAKQRCTFEVVGRRLGSAIDPVLILHDAKTFKELPGLYADDTIGLQCDARLTHTFENDQEIIIEVRDTIYRGGMDYRLRIGGFLNVDAPFPLTGKGSEIRGFISSNDKNNFLPDNHHPGDFSNSTQPTKPIQRGWSVSLPVSNVPEWIEREPNDDPKYAQAMPLPFGVSAKFETKNDRDCFAFDLKKGDKIRIVAEAAEFALPTEVYLRLRDKDGKELAKSDPMLLPAAIEYDATADGGYIVVAEHLNFAYGPLEAYHLVVRYREPDAIVSLGSNRVTAPGNIAIVNIARLHGHEGPLELKWDGPDCIVIKTTLSAKANPTDKFPLQVEVTATCKPGVYFGRILSKAEGRPARIATTLESLKKDIPNLPVLPAEMNGVIAVVVN